MPFTVNVGPYQGGNFLFQGLSSLGEGIGKGIQQFDEQRKTEAYNDMIVQHALNAGQVSLDEFNKYKAMSHSAKTGFAAGIAANFVEDMKKAQLAAQEEARKGSAELRQQQAAAFNWTPSDADRQVAWRAGGELVPTGPGKVSFQPYGDNAGGATGQPETLPFKNPITGEPVPGYAFWRLPGTKQAGVTQFGSDEPAVRVNVEGALEKRGPKNTWVPLNINEIMALRLQGVNIPGTQKKQTPPAATGPGFTSRIGDILDAIGSIGATSPGDLPGAPTPAPSPAAGTAASTAAGPDKNAILQQARDAISRGAPPAAVNARLQQMGIDPGEL